MYTYCEPLQWIIKAHKWKTPVLQMLHQTGEHRTSGGTSRGVGNALHMGIPAVTTTQSQHAMILCDGLHVDVWNWSMWGDTFLICICILEKWTLCCKKHIDRHGINNFYVDINVNSILNTIRCKSMVTKKYGQSFILAIHLYGSQPQ